MHRPDSESDLYSTNGHYVLAEADFDLALSLMPTHSNARNYMVETLVKYASLLEVQGDLENAKSKFEKVLRLKEDRRARTALAKLDRKKRSPSVEILENDNDKPESKNAKRSDVEEEKRKRRSTQEAERERKRERNDHQETARDGSIHQGCLDLAIQSLLLNHGLLPCPLSLVPESPPPGLVKTLNGLEKVGRPVTALKGLDCNRYCYGLVYGKGSELG
ncbi:hypothetical protein OSTOST_25236 [Ostertagia ostertagi]